MLQEPTMERLTANASAQKQAASSAYPSTDGRYRLKWKWEKVGSTNSPQFGAKSVKRAHTTIQYSDSFVLSSCPA